ncbi:MAG: DUF6338 family protein, partial [bacterium]
RSWYFASVVFILFLMPAIWPLLILKLRKWRPIGKHIVHPIKKPWDYVFSKRKSYWVIIHLKSGRQIGGQFGKKSFASSFPAEEQIFLQEVWELDEEEKFIKPIERSGGIIVLSDEILAIEFFQT